MRLFWQRATLLRQCQWRELCWARDKSVAAKLEPKESTSMCLYLIRALTYALDKSRTICFAYTKKKEHYHTRYIPLRFSRIRKSISLHSFQTHNWVCAKGEHFTMLWPRRALPFARAQEGTSARSHQRRIFRCACAKGDTKLHSYQTRGLRYECARVKPYAILVSRESISLHSL